MLKKHWLALPFVALTNIANSDERPPVQMPLSTCGMALPPVELIRSYEGPKAGPFILTGTQPSRRSKPVSLLSMNIQNLPHIPFFDKMNPHYRADRKACLGELSKKFTAAAFQEDIAQRDLEIGAWIPKFKKEYLLKSGHPGLSFQSSLAFQRVAAKPYTLSLCSGWFKHKNDCLISKGYQIVRLAGVTIVNTHTDAGRAHSDQDARRAQIEELSTALSAIGGPLLLVGDYNLNFHCAQDEATLRALLVRHGLTLYQRSSAEKGYDIVMARDVDIESIGKVSGRLLTDHEAGLVVNFYPPKQDTGPVLAAK